MSRLFSTIQQIKKWGLSTADDGVVIFRYRIRKRIKRWAPLSSPRRAECRRDWFDRPCRVHAEQLENLNRTWPNMGIGGKVQPGPDIIYGNGIARTNGLIDGELSSAMWLQPKISKSNYMDGQRGLGSEKCPIRGLCIEAQNVAHEIIERLNRHIPLSLPSGFQKSEKTLKVPCQKGDPSFFIDPFYLLGFARVSNGMTQLHLQWISPELVENRYIIWFIWWQYMKLIWNPWEPFWQHDSSHICN